MTIRYALWYYMPSIPLMMLIDSDPEKSFMDHIRVIRANLVNMPVILKLSRNLNGEKLACITGSYELNIKITKTKKEVE